MVEVASGMQEERRSGRGLNRLVRLSGRLLCFGLIGGAHLAWRTAAAALGIAGAAALIAAVPELLSQSDFAVSPAQAAITPTAPARTASGLGESWQAIARPIAVFGLESPELEKLTLVYSARRNPQGTERDDTLRFGRFADGTAHLHLAARRMAEVPEPAPRFFVALAREAAQYELALDHAAVPVAMPTKFGIVETADATLAGSAAARACIAFRHLSRVQPLQLSGWWCGTPERPADRGQLACLIDRLDLLSAGEDRPLRQVFTQAELNRNGACSVSRLALSGRKANWLDADGKAPALKKAGGEPHLARDGARKDNAARKDHAARKGRQPG